MQGSLLHAASRTMDWKIDRQPSRYSSLLLATSYGFAAALPWPDILPVTRPASALRFASDTQSPHPVQGIADLNSGSYFRPD